MSWLTCTDLSIVPDVNVHSSIVSSSNQYGLWKISEEGVKWLGHMTVRWPTNRGAGGKETAVYTQSKTTSKRNALDFRKFIWKKNLKFHANSNPRSTKQLTIEVKSLPHFECRVAGCWCNQCFDRWGFPFLSITKQQIHSRNTIHRCSVRGQLLNDCKLSWNFLSFFLSLSPQKSLTCPPFCFLHTIILPSTPPETSSADREEREGIHRTQFTLPLCPWSVANTRAGPRPS